MAIQEKPSRNEDEYFVKRDAEMIRELRARLDADRAKQEQSGVLNKCPKCGVELMEREHLHMKVDECPQCGGVWLDKGEIAMLEHVQDNQVHKYLRGLLKLTR